MSEAVRDTRSFGFGLKLHRIEAASMPANIGSIGVLLRNGFAREGLRAAVPQDQRHGGGPPAVRSFNAEEWSAGGGRGA